MHRGTDEGGRGSWGWRHVAGRVRGHVGDTARVQGCSGEGQVREWGWVVVLVSWVSVCT